MIKYLFLFFILAFNLLNAQTDWSRWSAKEPSYILNKTASNHDQSSGNFLLSAKKLYSIFISDLDGDNCPFHPTCSSFLVEAVQKTNLTQGMLMFADRFTRDFNLIKSRNEYPFLSKDHLWDPVEKYDLNYKEISFPDTN